MFVKKGYLIVFIILLGLIITSCSSGPKVESMSDNDTETEMITGDQIVLIKDPGLEQIIREQIEKPEGDITVGDMEMLYSININYEDTPVDEIDGLEFALNLNDFSFRNGTLKSLNPVGKLKNIGYLNISYSNIEEPILPFETPALDRINFIDTNISDFEFLKGATAAADISFMSCGITSIAFMKDWMALETISLDDNNVNDLLPLEGKTQIKYLSIHKNVVESIDALSSLTALESLNISYNKISNIAPIMHLESLTEFTAYEDLDKRIIDRGLLEELEAKGVLVEYHK